MRRAVGPVKPGPAAWSACIYSLWLLTLARIIPFYCERPPPTPYRFFILGLSLIFVFANGINAFCQRPARFNTNG